MLDQRLQLRAELLVRVRGFFLARDFLEVETPLLSTEIIPELHIEPLRRAPTQPDGTPTTFLMASPELHMKQLLCAGASAIFQITRSFRGGEQGRLHSEEFTIVEWYRVGDDMHAGIDLLDEFCQETVGAAPARRSTYRDVFFQHLGLDPHQADAATMSECGRQHGVAAPWDEQPDRDQWLNLLLAAQIEDHLGAAEPEIVYGYPKSQAALARVAVDPQGVETAQRFELYWRGVELANGYDELTDAQELRRRLTSVNAGRVADQRLPLPLPEGLLQAMVDPGLPRCSGCALGFDRLLMLLAKADALSDVRPGWPLP